MAIHDLEGTGTLVPTAAGRPRLREPTRVLVADSDPTTRQLLVSSGGKEAYQIVTVEDGREAYRMLKSDGDFKAVVFDMALPNVEGVETVRYMKTERRLMHIPIVVLAGARGFKLISECFSAGAIALLTKPFSADQLRRTLQMAISNQAAKNSSERHAKIE